MKYFLKILLSTIIGFLAVFLYLEWETISIFWKAFSIGSVLASLYLVGKKQEQDKLLTTICKAIKEKHNDSTKTN